jgi:hypothetical protein
MAGVTLHSTLPIAGRTTVKWPHKELTQEMGEAQLSNMDSGRHFKIA